MTALIDPRSWRLVKSPVEHAKVRCFQRCIFPGTHAHIRPLAPASLAEIIGAQARVSPVSRRPIDTFTEYKSLSRTVTDFGNQEPRIPPVLRGKGGVRQIENGNRKEAKIAVL